MLCAPPSAISLRSTQRCDNSGLYDTSMTYQDSCQTNRSVNRTYYRRQIQRLLLDDDSTNQMPRSQRSVRRNFSNSRRTRRQSPTTKLRSKPRQDRQPVRKTKPPAPRRIRRTVKQQQKSRAKRGLIKIPRSRRGTVSGFRGGGPGAGK